MFETLKKTEDDFVNETKFKILVDRMAKTNLKNSLTHFSYNWKEYPVKEVQEIFDSHEYILSVKGNREKPSEGNS